MEKKLKNSVTIRGDSLYCPLSLSLDSYGNCLTDCVHCYLRRLNHTWGEELKPLDLNLFEKKLVSGLNNKSPQTPLAWALFQKKTLRWGNKTDPFQEVEKEYRLAPFIFKILIDLEWSFVIQTRFTHILMEYSDWIHRANEKGLITIMPVISPGRQVDWEIFERKRTTPIDCRIANIITWKSEGIPIGVNGEPFIPGFHTVQDFEMTLKLLKSVKVESYNVYNFHFNAFVARRLIEIGIDIEKIWYYNQDKQWKPILQQLLDLSKKYGIRLGCPDFVNSGIYWVEEANTCCGINVANPCTFNTHHFKKKKQEGLSEREILQSCWDGTGDWKQGKQIVEGTPGCDFYTLKDIV